jgi:hypothetical protein
MKKSQPNPTHTQEGGMDPNPTQSTRKRKVIDPDDCPLSPQELFLLDNPRGISSTRLVGNNNQFLNSPGGVSSTPLVGNNNQFLNSPGGLSSTRLVGNNNKFLNSAGGVSNPLLVENSNQYLPIFATVDNFQAYQTFAKSILRESDYERVGGKRFITRRGWRKLAFGLQISLEYMKSDIQYGSDGLVESATFVQRAILPSGRFVDGWGSCSRREKGFSKPNHDIPATAETRAKNRACQDLTGLDLP